MTDNEYLNVIRDLFYKHDIASAVVAYEGGGDSGSSDLSTITYLDGTKHEPDSDGWEKLNDITAEDVPYTSHEWKNDEYVDVPALRDICFPKLLVEAADHFVDKRHGGWENNEGGRGSVTFYRETQGIQALAEAVRQRILVKNHHVDYIMTEDESEHEWVSDATETE